MNIDATIPGVLEDHSPNFHAGRDGYAVLAVVIHVEEGSEEGTDSWFHSAKSDVSAHYSVDKAGVIRQFVAEADSANHAGVVDNPTAALVLEHPTVNPNRFTIGIEHEGTGRVDLTAAQRAASVALVGDICRRHAISIDRHHIIRHHEIRASKTCPGAIDVDLLVAQVKWAAATKPVRPPSTPDDHPLVVWSEFLHDNLVVTGYVNDRSWSFVPFAHIAALEQIQSTTPLSKMPLTKPK